MNASKETGTAKKKSATKTKTPRAQHTGTRPAAGSRKAKYTSSSIAVTSEERWRMVAVAAYHKAEQRGFTPEGSMDDWLEAEREIDALLGTGQT